MALFRCSSGGSGGGFDFSKPDFADHVDNADLRSTGATVHFTTTAKPKYIVVAHGFNSSTNVPHMRTTLVDVEKGKCSLIQYYGGWATNDTEREMDLQFGVTNVTSTGFDIVKSASTTTAYNVKYLGVFAWY